MTESDTLLIEIDRLRRLLRKVIDWENFSRPYDVPHMAYRNRLHGKRVHDKHWSEILSEIEKELMKN